MLGQIIAIAKNTFVESIRQPVFIVLILVYAVWMDRIDARYSDDAAPSDDA